MRKLLKRGNFLSQDDLRTQILEFIDYFNRTMAHWCQLKPKALLNKDRRMDYAMLIHHQSTINQAL
jgi:CMP-N-acetylneuraminic acid synthetase